MFGHAVDAIRADLDHVEQVDFTQVDAVHGLLVVGVDHADFALGVIAGLEGAPVVLFEAAALDDFDYAKALNEADEFVLQVIGQGFYDDLQAGYLDKMQQALSSGDLDSLRMTAHSLKSLLGSFGLSPAQALSGQIEELCRQQRLDETGPLLAQLQAETGLFQPLLRERLSRL